MPIYNPEKRLRLRELGYNPDEINEFTPPGQEPVVAQQPTKEVPQVGRIRSVLSNAAAAVPSAAAALYAGSQYGTAATAVGGPLLGIPVGIASAIATGILARKAQDAIVRETPLGPAYEKELQQTQEAHPNYSAAGEVLGGLPFMRPSIGVLKSGTKAITRPLTGVPASAADKANLLNVAIGAATPAALNIAQGEPLTARTAIESLGGAFLNKPTGIGKRIGLHGGDIEKPLTVGDNTEPIPAAKEPLLLPERTGPIITPEPEVKKPIRVGPQVDNLTAVDQQLKQAPVLEEYVRAKQEKEALEAKLTEETRRLQEQTALLKKVGGLEPLPSDVNYKPAEVEPIVRGELETEVRPQLPEYKPEDVDPKDINWQDTNTPETGKPTQGVASAFRDELAPKRGVTLDDSKVVRNPSTSEEVKGAAYIKERLAKVNPNSASADTYPHELFHIFSRDLATSKHPKDVALMARANRIAKESSEFAAWAKENPGKSAHEFLTSRVGVDTIRRVLNTDNTGNIKNWFKDFWAYQRGKDVKSIERVMSNRLVNDPSHAERFGGGEVTPTVRTTTDENKPADVEFARGPAPATPPANPTTPLSKQKFSIPGLRSSIEKINSIKSPKAGILARGFTKFYDDYTAIKGKLDGVLQEKLRTSAKLKGIGNILSKPGEYLAQDNPLLQGTLRKMYAARDGAKPIFSKEEQTIRTEVQKVLKEVRDMQNARPGLREASEVDPNYIPHITKPSVIELIGKNRDSAEAKQLIKDFVDYQSAKLKTKGAKNPVDQAEENLETILEGYNKRNPDVASNYGPIDKAEGIGLPESWRETNLLNAMHRYLDRVSRRFAYHDNIESRPDVIDAHKTLAQDDAVKQVMGNISGVKPPIERKRSAIFSIVKSSGIGTLSGLRDFTANFTLGMQHQQNPLQTAITAGKAVAGLKKFVMDGIESGRIRQNINELEWGDTVGVLRRTADVISDAQGRNYLERITRGISMGMGELTTMDFNKQMMKGNASSAAKKWFKDFGEGIDGKKLLTREELLRISGRFVDSVQGTYDARGLPNFAMEGTLSPVFALARWNIEKANNYAKHVISPALEGNLRPFLMSTLGMVVGGAAVTELTELITGRKEKTPKFEEIKAGYDVGKNVTKPILYKALGLATSAGYAGILSDFAKSAMDRLYAKTKPRWYNNMLIESADNFRTSVENLIETVGEGDLDFETLANFSGQVIADNLQAARLVLNRIGKREEDIEKSNKIRDLRTFNLIEGNDVSELYENDYSKKFKGKDAEEFKETTDPQKAAELVPDLISKALDKAEGNPEKLRKELDKLKRNSYQTMPNPETLPDSFIRYLSFLEKTQGKEARDQRLLDYLERNSLNRAKSEMIP